MTTSKFTTSPVDHHLQADILRALFRTKAAIPFSQLKPDGIENSLFMYHARKLERRGLIERTPEGFVLTPSGTQWINFVSPSFQPKLIPRPLINFYITSPDGNHVLLSRRVGQGANHLNQYLFPGGFHRYGVQLDAAARGLLEKLTGHTAAITYEGTVEMIYALPHAYTHHTLCYFFRATLPQDTIEGESDYDYTWAPIDDVRAGRYESMPARVVELRESSGLAEFTTLFADYTNPK